MELQALEPHSFERPAFNFTQIKNTKEGWGNNPVWPRQGRADSETDAEAWPQVGRGGWGGAGLSSLRGQGMGRDGGKAS